MSFVRIEAKGSAIEITELLNHMNAAIADRGGRVMIEDPTVLANGGGNIEVEFPDLDERDARSTTQALLDQLPGAAERFRIIDRE